MKYEGRYRWAWWLLLLFLVALMAAACTKAMIENIPDKSGVQVHLDWGNQVIPSGMRFYFYPAEGESVGLVQTETSVAGYEGELSLGRYQLLTYNTDASGVTFLGMENYSTATVSTNSVSTRSDGVTLISQPSLLYAGVTEELEVPCFEQVSKTVSPRLLTKTLKLKFNMEQLSGVNRVEGELHGLFSSVLLSTGEATQLVREQAPGVGTSFAMPVASTVATVSISYLGILNPEKGENYKNEMPVTLKGNDGWEQTTKVDLSQVLTDIVSEEPGGGFEFEIEDEIKITVEPTPKGLSAYVISWTRYGDGEGDIFYTNY